MLLKMLLTVISHLSLSNYLLASRLLSIPTYLQYVIMYLPTIIGYRYSYSWCFDIYYLEKVYLDFSEYWNII